MSWIPERVEQLKKHWAAGESASAIAATLGGVTRNAVIGKAHRLGLAGRRVERRRPRSPGSSFRSYRRKSRTPSGGSLAKTKATKTVSAMLGPAPEFPVTVETLTQRLCRWPEGDPKQAGFHFCGRVKGGTQGPYCGAHASLAYR